MHIINSLFFVLIGASVSFAEDAYPIMVGGEENLDACSGYGRVMGLNPNGHNYLSVRKGPSTNFSRLDKLGPDQNIWVCDTNGSWLGVVYSATQGIDCEVSMPIEHRIPYNGPCNSGWVYSKYVLILAD